MGHQACWLRVMGPCHGSKVPQGTWFLAGVRAGHTSKICQQRRDAWRLTCGRGTQVDLQEAPELESWASQAKVLRSSAAPVSRKLPSCARKYIANCKLWRFERSYSTVLTPLLSRAYLIHHTRNVKRREFQMSQLPQLGLPLTIVAGLDGEEISERVRTCVLANSSEQECYSQYLLVTVTTNYLLLTTTTGCDTRQLLTTYY